MIAIGNNNINAIPLGNTPVSAVYKGMAKIWPIEGGGEPGMYAWYKFDNGLDDSSGNGRHATLAIPFPSEYDSGLGKNVLRCNNLGGTPVLTPFDFDNTWDNWRITFKAYFDGPAGFCPDILQTGTAYGDDGFKLEFLTSWALLYGGQSNRIIFNDGVNNNAWNDIEVFYNAEEVGVIVNGVKYSVGNGHPNFNHATQVAGKLRIGGTDATSSRAFSGKISDLKIYKY
jgi:hypothetical protein